MRNSGNSSPPTARLSHFPCFKLSSNLLLLLHTDLIGTLERNGCFLIKTNNQILLSQLSYYLCSTVYTFIYETILRIPRSTLV